MLPGAITVGFFPTSPLSVKSGATNNLFVFKEKRCSGEKTRSTQIMSEPNLNAGKWLIFIEIDSNLQICTGLIFVSKLFPL